MARATWELITGLRTAARRLEGSEVPYKWSHFAHCNCGHLVQALLGLDTREIQRSAMRQPGDWGEQAAAHAERTWNRPQPHPTPDYGDRPALDEGAWEPENVGVCTATGTPLDAILVELGAVGLEPADVRHLERLSDPEVRRLMGNNKQDFLHYRRQNVVDYMKAWAELLETRIMEDCARAAE